MTDNDTPRLDPGMLHLGSSSMGLGATDEEMLAMHEDPDHMAFLRKEFSFMDDTEFEALMRSMHYELSRPFDAEEELEDEDDEYDDEEDDDEAE